MSYLRLFPCWMMGVAVAAGWAVAAENEPVGDAPIVSLALFKNGVVSVMREVKPPAKDAFLLVDKIEPAHGTLWCTADDGFRLTTVSRPFQKTLETPPLNDICQAYDGRKVTVTFLAATSNALASCEAKGDGMLTLFPAAGGAAVPTEITGTVINPIAREQAKNFSRDYGEENRWWYSSRYYDYDDPYGRLRRPIVLPSHLTLRLESGPHVSIPIGIIVGIQSDSINTTAKETREVWRIEGAQKPFVMTYLSKGVTWAPAYRVTLLDDKQMNITMSSIIRNEMAAFKDANVNLISGFPNIEFANRTSLIVPGSTIASFFDGLLRPQDSGQRAVMSQRMILSNSAEPFRGADGYNLPSIPEDEGSMDIHHRNIGKLTMDVGETLYLPQEEAKAQYERVVEWTVPDRRDLYGRIQNVEKGMMGDFWDTVRFRNPFKSPITTAPIEILDGGKVLGQSTVTWTNPGQEVSVKITKALSVAGTYAEQEVDRQRPKINWGGSTYRNPDVECEFKVKNYRGFPVKVVVRFQMSGEYISASVEPTNRRVLEMGVYGVNKRQELTWTLTLAPGQEETVTYSYSVFVL